MYCTHCGRQLGEGDRFCPSCGWSTDPNAPSPAARISPRLSRPMHEKKIAGVCAGFARYLNVDVTLVRIIWLVVALAFGTGFLAYIVAWIAMPADYGETRAADQPPATPPPAPV